MEFNQSSFLHSPQYEDPSETMLDQETILLMVSDLLHQYKCESALQSLEGELRQIICCGRLMRDLSVLKSSLLDGEFMTALSLLGTYSRSHPGAVR